MENRERFDAFITKVRSLWHSYRTSDDELYTRVWAPRLSKLPPDVVGQALAKHAAEYPDELRPKWAMVYKLIGNRASNLNSLEILIMQYRKSKDRKVRQRFADKTDAEVWQYFIEAQIYPVMFGCQGQFRDDIERATGLAKLAIVATVEAMRHELHDEGADVPEWLEDVGIPDRWLAAYREREAMC